MSRELDITDQEHPECRDRVLAELGTLREQTTLEIEADHNPEPVLRQYEEEEDVPLDWETQQDGPDHWTVTVSKATSKSNGTFDVREMPPPERHGSILEKVQTMDVGESFTLINDHDPKPLFYELTSIHGDAFDWEYVKKEKNDYRVKITKTDESKELPEQASTRVDVRVIPPHDRHKTIFHRFDLLVAGDAMEIVADHDPEPLRRQLDDVHGEDQFKWDYLLEEPGECRVLLTKTEGTENKTQEESAGDQTTGGVPEDAPELDVRSYEPQKRHDLIYDRYNDLESGEAFVLVNDHDPKPLYYQMKEEMSGELQWEYIQQGGDEWKVLIGKE